MRTPKNLTRATVAEFIRERDPLHLLRHLGAR